MATNTDDAPAQWVSEWEIATRTGLPGPLIAALLPHLPTPPNGYSASQPLYTADSIQRAQLAALMLRAGIRKPFIKGAVAEPLTPERLAIAITEWTPLADAADPPQPWWRQHRTPAVALLAFIATSILLAGILLGALAPH
jgi:hypothetical protein